jgi:signal peptidase I
MQPTITPGDICLCKMNNKYHSKELKRGMVILFKHKDYDFILTKRLIAKEDDLVEIKNKKILINKEIIEEPYINGTEKENIDNPICDIDSILIGNDKIFVMGDNRNKSLDSRNAEFGLVNISDIVGKPLLILWSKNKKKIFKSLFFYGDGPGYLQSYQ